MKPRVTFSLALGLIGLAGVAALSLVWFSKPASPPSLPTPNGYNDLLQAGQMLSAGSAVPDEPSTKELEVLVKENAQALRLARIGLQKECRVPLGNSMSYISNHLAEVTMLKRLARGFMAEGKLAERENQSGKAAAAYLDVMRLGHEGARGGVIIDSLVGLACRSQGCQAMERILNQLPAPDCREAIRKLEEMDATGESPTQVLNQERSWSRRTFGWRGQLAGLLMQRRMRQTQQPAVAKIQAQQRTERRLLVDLAARAYELEKGQAPATMADLVPAYLKFSPQDPLTGTAMTWR